MLISVIIPTFNRSKTLERAISSVLNQTYKDYELIIIDDCSTDNTLDLLSKYKEKVTIIKNSSNAGVSYSRNQGLKIARGEYVAFLDSDDEWLPHKLKIQVNFIKQNPLELVHGEELWIRNNKVVNQKKIHEKSGGYIFEKCLPLCLIAPSAVMIKTSTLKELGGFNEEYVVCEDYDLWLRMTSLYEVGFINEPILNKYGGHEDQLSMMYKAMDYYRVKSLNSIYAQSSLSEKQKEQVAHEICKKSKILINGYLKHNNLTNLEEIQNIYRKHSKYSDL